MFTALIYIQLIRSKVFLTMLMKEAPGGWLAHSLLQNKHWTRCMLHWSFHWCSGLLIQLPALPIRVAAQLFMLLNIWIWVNNSTPSLTKNKLKILLEREKGDSAAVSAEWGAHSEAPLFIQVMCMYAYQKHPKQKTWFCLIARHLVCWWC